MKTLVIFVATALICVQASQVQLVLTSSPTSSEEEYQVILPATKGQIFPGVTVVNPAVVQSVKIKVPRYVTGPLKQQFITQALAAQGIVLPVTAVPGPAKGSLTRGARQTVGATAGAAKVVSGAKTVADVGAAGPVTELPKVLAITKVPAPAAIL